MQPHSLGGAEHVAIGLARVQFSRGIIGKTVTARSSKGQQKGTDIGRSPLL